MSTKNCGLRPEVAMFAEAMEAKLGNHDQIADWEDESLRYLMGKLRIGADKLQHTYVTKEGIVAEIADVAVDVANFAMIIYSKTMERGNASKNNI